MCQKMIIIFLTQIEIMILSLFEANVRFYKLCGNCNKFVNLYCAGLRNRFVWRDQRNESTLL